jgi:hypothetical protein
MVSLICQQHVRNEHDNNFTRIYVRGGVDREECGGEVEVGSGALTKYAGLLPELPLKIRYKPNDSLNVRYLDGQG